MLGYENMDGQAEMVSKHMHTYFIVTLICSFEVCSIPKMEGNAVPIIIHFWKVFTQKIFTPKVDGNGTFSYIVTKMNNNNPILDCSSLPLLDVTFIVKQSSIFGLF